MLCVYGNRQNLGIIRTHENALWSLGVHDLSVILYLLDEDPVEAVALGRDFLKTGVEDVVFCYLRFPSGKIAHMHLSWLDPHKMRKMTVVGTREDGRLRRHGARPQGHRLREVALEAGRHVRRVADAHRRHPHPEDRRPTSRSSSSAARSSRLVAGEGDRRKVARDGARVVRALDMLTTSLNGS